jgi:hypothetical protein
MSTSWSSRGFMTGATAIESSLLNTITYFRRQFQAHLLLLAFRKFEVCLHLGMRVYVARVC